ncbi:MAG: hypothetical protein WC700_18580 [Gemmatimonadaceae bacterium]|jgi:hypothetical protein
MNPDLLQFLANVSAGPSGSIEFPGLGIVQVLVGTETGIVRDWLVETIRSCAERDLITARATPEHKDAP